MRKTFAFITAALMLLSLMPFGIAATTTPEGIPVSSSAEFAAMAADGTYYLAADIVLMETYETTFTGTLDGNGHKITVAMAAFKEFNGTVKNLTIDGDVTDSAAFARLATGQITVENVTNNANVKGKDASSSYGGGIVAQVVIGDGKGTATFTNCVNNGTVDSVKIAGGIVAQSCAYQNEIHNCINNGSISGGTYVAGIVGNAGNATNATSDFHITNCINNGEIFSSATATAGAAGIIARCSTKDQILEYIVENCANNGKVTINSTTTDGDYAIYAGGVCGYMLGDAGNAVRHCYNTADVSVTSVLTTSAGAKASYAAGVLAYANGGTFELTDCYSTGKITCTDTRVYHNYTTANAAAVGINPSSSGSGLFENNWYLEGSCEIGEKNGAMGDCAQTFTLDELKNGTLCTKINENCVRAQEYQNGAYYYMDGQECTLYDLVGKTAAPEFKIIETEATTKVETTAKKQEDTEPETTAEATQAVADDTTAAVVIDTTKTDEKKGGCGSAVGLFAVTALIPAAFALRKKKE